MKTRFNGIYTKQAWAGFCGQLDVVRTPALSEVLKQVCGQLLHIAFDDPKMISDQGKKLFRGLLGKPLDEIVQTLVEELYFEPCMVGCGNDDCREWHEVYGLTNGNVYCHVSECQLDPYEVDQTDDLDADQPDMPFLEWVQKRVVELMAEPEVIKICAMGVIQDSAADLFRKKGYAEALQDILNIFSPREAEAEEVPEKEDSLTDV